ncbi:MAG: Spy/CpxP family protein refolding chaperone [Phycisphaerae bacterium]
MKSRFLCALTCLTFVSGFAYSQDENAPPPPPPPGDMRGGRFGPGGPGGPGGPMNVGRMAERLAEELQLDDAQKAQYDDIVARYRKEFAGDGQLFEQMRAARESGDQEQMREIGQQMRQRRQAMDQAMGRFYDEVRPILREDQVQRLDESRERQQARERRNPMRAVQELRDSLNLDATQQQQFDEMLQSVRERMMASREGGEMREMFEQMRAAREAGDMNKVEQLRQQFADRNDFTESMESFMDDLAPILRDDQKAALEAFRDRYQASAARGEATDFRTLIAAARRVDLNPEQARALKQVYDEARRAAREVRSGDSEGRATLAAKVRDDIRSVLTADQYRQFEQNLERANRSGDRERRGGQQRDPQQRGDRRRGDR